MSCLGEKMKEGKMEFWKEFGTSGGSLTDDLQN
jgi:hypothetical protein